MDFLDNCLLKQKTVQADPLQLHLQGHHIQNTRMIVADLYSCIRKQKPGSFPQEMAVHKGLDRRETKKHQESIWTISFMIF